MGYSNRILEVILVFGLIVEEFAYFLNAEDFGSVDPVGLAETNFSVSSFGIHWGLGRDKCSRQI